MSVWIPGIILGLVVIIIAVVILCNLAKVSKFFERVFQFGNRSKAHPIPTVILAAPAVCAILIGLAMMLFSLLLGPPDAS